MNLDEYQRAGNSAYAEFARTTASILEAAISAEPQLRLQQVKDRAKDPDSLRRKLGNRGILDTETLEADIKDLAGCRVIFYTNTDVTRFIHSGLIDQNFNVLEVKLHQPGREIEDATELYTSNHYVVTLKPERLALPEYRRFQGMRCEVQIQTILNHAWAEMAHDTIYKAPSLGAFGGKAFDLIKARLQKVARKYLGPAGYEFQKIASDFQRLVEGKALFDANALDAIVDAPDNNARLDALETFSESVLPLYDDIPSVYSDVASRLMVAADRARSAPLVSVQTPSETLPARSYADILRQITELLTRYRHAGVEETFEALRVLYSTARTEEEYKPLRDLAEKLAKHDIHVWQQQGPIVQAILVNRLEAMPHEELLAFGPMMNVILRQILGSELSGTTSHSGSITLHRGSVVASPELSDIRKRALNLLKRQFQQTKIASDRDAILSVMQAATYHAYSRPPTDELYLQILADAREVLLFEAEVALPLSLQSRQKIEERAYRSFWRYGPGAEGSDPEPIRRAKAEVRDAALSLRDKLNADSDFPVYKILVGHDSVFPPAWDDKEFDHESSAQYRAEQADALSGSVDDHNAEAWFERLVRYAQTKSDDAATFPTFGTFLEKVSARRPDIALSYIDRRDDDLMRFLPGMLMGLMRSPAKAQVSARLDAWLAANQYLPQITHYLRFAQPFDESLLQRTLASAIHHQNNLAVRNVLIAAAQQFAAAPGDLVNSVFMPAVRYLGPLRDFGWVDMTWFSWLSQPLVRQLDEGQAAEVLSTLVEYPKLERAAEYIAASIAKRWPGKVLEFLGQRQAFGEEKDVSYYYDAIPFEVHQLRKPLAAVPDLMLEHARVWFERHRNHFRYDGAKLLASVFPEIGDALQTRLLALARSESVSDREFVLEILAAFEGKQIIYELVRTIVASAGHGNSLLEMAHSTLLETGGARGEYGFADIYSERRTWLSPWLEDSNEAVRTFSRDVIRDLEFRIAAENRSAQASISLRKLEYNEELDTDPPAQ